MDVAIKTNKFRYQGHKYVLHRRCKGYVRWRCCKAISMKCVGSLITTAEKNDPMLVSLHNHSADENAVNMVRPRVEFLKPPKLRARIPLQASSDNQKSIQANLVIEGIWRTTGENMEENFLLSDSGPESRDRKIIFAADSGLRLLAESPTWYFDKNFSLPPPGFAQIVALRVRSNEVLITGAFCLLTSSGQDAYEDILGTILTQCSQRGYYPDPLYVHLDFDKPAMLAAKAVFGEHVRVHTCFPYLNKLTRSKIPNNGEFSGMINALAFLPPGEVERGICYLRKIVPAKFERLLEDFDDTFVSGTFRRAGRPLGDSGLITMRNILARFPPELWNASKLDAGDSSLVECWDDAFFRIVGKDKPPTIWTLISKMQEEVVGDRFKIENKGTPTVQQKKKIKTCEMMRTRFVDLSRRYVDSEINLGEFLECVGHNIQLMYS